MTVITTWQLKDSMEVISWGIQRGGRLGFEPSSQTPEPLNQESGRKQILTREVLPWMVRHRHPRAWNLLDPAKVVHWRRQWHPTPVLLPGKSHGWRSLIGCSPWGRKESDTTERLHFHFSLSWIGEGNGNPLQCSCLENPRDGGAWWAAVYGVAQS